MILKVNNEKGFKSSSVIDHVVARGKLNRPSLENHPLGRSCVNVICRTSSYNLLVVSLIFCCLFCTQLGMVCWYNYPATVPECSSHSPKYLNTGILGYLYGIYNIIIIIKIIMIIIYICICIFPYKFQICNVPLMSQIHNSHKNFPLGGPTSFRRCNGPPPWMAAGHALRYLTSERGSRGSVVCFTSIKWWFNGWLNRYVYGMYRI
jgi:hypothetical protein